MPMTHTHILRIGNAVLTVKVRELPERVVTQVFFNNWQRNQATVAVLFLSRVAVDYRNDSRPFCVHESNGKQLMIL